MEIIIAIVGAVAAVIGVILAWPSFRLAWRQWRIDGKQPTTVEIQTERLKVLAVIPAPVLGAEGNNPPAVRLDIWKEWQNLEEAIKELDPNTGRGKPIALTRLLPPTRDKLQRALANCDVLHFSGHGTASGLLLEKEHGREDLVTSNDFAKLFADSRVKLIVLSACKSVKTAKALCKAEAPAVIATQEPVSDNVAKLFSSRFYAELTDGKTFDTALKVAQSAIEREYGAEHARNFTLLGKKKSRLKMPKKPAAEPIIDFGEPRNIGLPTNLCMVDRGAELVEISEKLEQASTRLVCVHGIGGIGKSHLAIETAHRNAWRFSDGILWLKVETPGFQLADICRNIGYLLEINQKEMSEEQLRHKALDAISARKCLIILDNAETIQPDERKRIAGFLSGFDPRRGSKALVTSRAAIAEFEQLDGAVPLHSVGKFEDIHATQLLYEEAIRRNLWTEIKSKVNEFLQHGRGHPFLLSRSVAWAKDRGVEPALRDLAQLKGDAEAASKELVGKMVDGLNEPGRCVLRVMPLFEGGADETAINAVCGEIADAGIRELTGSGLLDYDHGTKRYSLHPLVADYVTANLPLEGDEEQTARQRHAQHYAKVAEKYKETPMEQWRILDVDWENIRSGANFAVQELARSFGVDDEPESLRNLLTKELSIEGREEQIQLAGDYCWALYRYVYWRRSADRLRLLLAGAVAFHAHDDKKRLVATYNNIGLIYGVQGSYEEALEWYKKSVEIKEQIGDRAGLAATYNNIGLIYYAQGSYDEALQWYQKSVQITEQIGDRAVLATTYNNIGEIHRAQRSYKEALEWYKKSVEIFEQLGDRAGLATTYNNIGSIYHAQGSYDEALQWYQKSVQITEQIGDRAGLARTYNNIGLIYHAQGSYSEALQWYKRSLEIREQIGDRAGLAVTLSNIGVLEMERGHLQRALEHLSRSRDLSEQIGLEKDVALVEAAIAEVRRRMGTEGESRKAEGGSE